MRKWVRQMIIKKLFPVGILVLFSVIRLSGRTSLSGDLSNYPLDAVNNPFIIEKDIEVPSGKRVIINEGCVFLFKQFTGLNVSGSLIVKGTPSRPVIFTTINDSVYSHFAGQVANPFDWNGITIDKNAGEVAFNEFKLMYSVYGIKSQRRDLIIKNGRFASNGQFHFTIFDKIQYVQENMSFSYPNDSAMVDFSLPPIRPAGIDARNRFHKRIGKGCFITSPLFIIAGAGFLYYAVKGYDNSEKTKNFLDHTLLPSTDEKIVEMHRQYNDEIRKADTQRNLAVAFFGLGAVTLSVGLILYF